MAEKVKPCQPCSTVQRSAGSTVSSPKAHHPLVVDQPHLLEHSRLARLARSQKKHLDLIAEVRAVPLELLVDLGVAWGVCQRGRVLAGHFVRSE